MRVKCVQSWNAFKKGEIYNAEKVAEGDETLFVYFDETRPTDPNGEQGRYVYDHRNCFKIIKEKKED